jgi:hypothetical protein
MSGAGSASFFQKLTSKTNELGVFSLRQFKPKQSIWIIAIAVAGFLAFYFDSQTHHPISEHESVNPESAATQIPAGFVLVPIEVSNYESLDSILGQFGVVDLYVPADDPKKRARKVATHLKILRAPLNPSHFAVLAKETESANLVSNAGPFMVIVQNPEHSGTGFVNSPDTTEKNETPTRRRNSRITVEVEDGKAG